MNPDNLTIDEQFNLFGCASRCLIRLAKEHGKEIIKEDFIKRFSTVFPPKKCGLTNTAEQIEIAKGLGLCQSAISLRDLRKVRWFITENKTSGVLVLTDRRQDGSELFHCRLLLSTDTRDCVLFSPCQSGKDYELPESWENLEKEFVHFLVLV